MTDNTTKGAAGRPAFSVLICPDSYIWQGELDKLLARFRPPIGEWQKKAFWGDEDPPQNFWDEFTTTDLLGTSRYLLVHQAERWSSKIWDNIDKMIFRLTPTCWPIFCLEGAWTYGKPKLSAAISKSKCVKIAEKKGWVWKQEGLTEKTVRAYIADRAKQYPGIPRPVVDDLALTGIYDARSLENELRKLSLYYTYTEKKAGAGETEDVKLKRERDCNYSVCIRHIKAGNLKGAFESAYEDNDTEKVFFVLLSLLDREFRSLWELRTGQSTLEGPSKYYKSQEAKNVSMPLLARAMSIVVEAEWSVKQGIASIPQALDTLIIQLIDLFAKKNTPL